VPPIQNYGGRVARRALAVWPGKRSIAPVVAASLAPQGKLDLTREAIAAGVKFGGGELLLQSCSETIPPASQWNQA
jgi:hypothetical protein